MSVARECGMLQPADALVQVTLDDSEESRGRHEPNTRGTSTQSLAHGTGRGAENTGTGIDASAGTGMPAEMSVTGIPAESTGMGMPAESTRTGRDPERSSTVVFLGISNTAFEESSDPVHNGGSVNGVHGERAQEDSDQLSLRYQLEDGTDVSLVIPAIVCILLSIYSRNHKIFAMVISEMSILKKIENMFIINPGGNILH